MRCRVRVRVGCDFRYRASSVNSFCIMTAILPIVLSCDIGRVEVALEILNRKNGVGCRWPSAPTRVPVAPVRQCNMAWGRRDRFRHRSQQHAIGIELDGVGRPVKAILMEAFVGLKRELVNVEVRRTSGTETLVL